MEGNSTTPKNCVLTNFLNERGTYNFPSGFLTNMILNFAQENYYFVHLVTGNYSQLGGIVCYAYD